MKRTLAVVAVLLACSAAQAASIEVIRQYNGSHPEDPGPGDTFTLTVIATADAGETDNTVFGRLVFDNSFVANLAAATVQQTALISPVGGGLPWITGPVTCTSDSCDMFNQVFSSPQNQFTVTNTPFAIASVTFLITAAGNLSAHWETSGPFAFDFFGAPVPPDVCIIGSACPIPEPATGGLLALGLLALAAGRRRAAC